MTSSAVGRPRALIVGLGISGMSTAIALERAGWEPVVIEKATGRRRGGYFIALTRAGRAPAERLGILDRLHNRISDKQVFEIDRAGRRRPGVGFADLPVRPWMLLRGDVEQAAYDALPDGVEIRYSTVPTKIEQDDDGVDVTLRTSGDGTEARDVTERFDLVVGADGLRSTVRQLAFGPHEQFLHKLDYMIAAFEMPRDISGFTRGEGAILTEEGRSFWMFPFADHPPTALFTYRTDDIDAEFATPAAERIREVYGTEPLGPILTEAIRVLETQDEYLFDSVEQVHLDSWHRGRVVLVGDSAWCVTLYAGMGVSGGLAGADLLGTMLSRHGGDLDAALTAWERQLRPYVEEYQKIGLVGRVFFNPANHAEKVRRSMRLRVRRSPLVGRLLGRVMARSKQVRVREEDIAAA